jgi:hypothetical protein
MELALSLEKLNFQKLRELHDIASDANDAQMCDFIEGTLLAPQVGGGEGEGAAAAAAGSAALVHLCRYAVDAARLGYAAKASMQLFGEASSWPLGRLYPSVNQTVPQV